MNKHEKKIVYLDLRRQLRLRRKQLAKAQARVSTYEDDIEELEAKMAKLEHAVPKPLVDQKGAGRPKKV